MGQHQELKNRCTPQARIRRAATTSCPQNPRSTPSKPSMAHCPASSTSQDSPQATMAGLRSITVVRAWVVDELRDNSHFIRRSHSYYIQCARRRHARPPAAPSSSRGYSDHSHYLGHLRSSRSLPPYFPSTTEWLLQRRQAVLCSSTTHGGQSSTPPTSCVPP